MTRALIYKEFRETLPIAGLALATLLFIAAWGMGFRPIRNLFNDRYGTIPFLSDSFQSRSAIVSGVFAMALGFWQMIGDFRGDAQLFLMHRPVSRRRIYGVKLATGLAIYLACSGLAILLYALWAATPGTHASPFAWSMTLGAWRMWLLLTGLYLGAALSGIYPAAWLGTRLAPLAAAGALVSIINMIPLPYGIDLLLLALIDAALVAAVLYTVSWRDFV